ncbi:O-acetyl-ADP-ribose deacetylase [Oceanimonas pelagia]|uniref:O-acetyl-ADP-ribose deacetylase n=1 Tax=Oceanimonas pelagia TaxID=3028314 RepID=A0AA50Q921_9GAMM|nr:O-acetyl-ADP-ribose deacetylase [Oceanimonas pelagia]WMC09323.1 O-acetyl-ADP-ribose deacetylase [Oceanimonas pelagia]
MNTAHRGAMLECVQGDITQQPDMDAIVNAANGALLPGGGVAGAIHRAAGPGLVQECRKLAPIHPGEAVSTGGHRLPNRHVIHCLGPVYGVDEPAAALLASCYRQALRLAEQQGLASVAFPAISTGVFGYPLEPAARIAVNTVKATLAECPGIKRVRFVLFSAADLACYRRVLAETGE